MEPNSVLFVDDERNILGSLKRGLIDEEYKCFFCLTSEEALEILAKENISVIVTDIKMPGINGLELLKIVKENYPLIVRIVLSGYIQLPQVLAVVNQGDIFRFITKPWSLEKDLKPIIRQAIKYYNLERERQELHKRLEEQNLIYQKILKSTEKKAMNHQKDMKNLRRISSFIFSNFIDSYQDITVENIKETAGIYNSYLDSLPSSITEFSIGDLEKEFKEHCSTVQLNIDSQTTIMGDYSFWINFITFLLEHLPERFNVPLFLNIGYTTSDKTTIRIALVISIPIQSPDNEMTLITPLIKMLGEIIGFAWLNYINGDFRYWHFETTMPLILTARNRI